MPGGKCKDKVTLPYQAKLNSAYQKHDFKTVFETTFKEKKHIDHDNGAVLHNTPFQCCQMPNFIKDAQFLEGLKEELVDQIFYEKNNDLYKFQQTDDLKQISTPHVVSLKKLFYGDFKDWLSEITGITFTDKVDLTCSRYDYTDILLCHDDELDTRRIAFILYLVPPWSTDDGGTLDLFNMDEHGQPQEIVKSLVPCWNSFAWFEVTEASHHQVSEVLSTEKTRLSVNGWFHAADPVPRPLRYIEPPHVLQPHQVTEENFIANWINPIYLDPEVQGEIQEKFENDSEIELQGFIRDEKYQAVCEALHGDSMTWHLQGPPNKRCYERASTDSLPDIVQQCMDFLRSEELFLTLSNLTGLALHYLAADNKSDSESEADGCGNETPGGSTVQSVSATTGELQQQDSCSMEESEGETPQKKIKLDEKTSKREKKIKEMSPKCLSEVRRWGPGRYTLLHDTDSTQSEYALDAMFYCSCKGWDLQYGGYTSYISKGDDEELLSVSPADNSLALVYRDKETLGFVKHINSQATQHQSDPSFYDFHLVYYE